MDEQKEKEKEMGCLTPERQVIIIKRLPIENQGVQCAKEVRAKKYVEIGPIGAMAIVSGLGVMQ